jgi:heat-inducible transcriptional repressor
MLKDRETIVLKHVVDEFVHTNRAVGSEKLSARLGLSSASIRNTMNVLLQEGFLIQPHTSAGRIPSDIGYRYFVDYLLEEYILAETEGRAVQDTISAVQTRMDRMLKNVVRMLSNRSDCLAFASAPEVENCFISRLDITPVSSRRALLILVLSNDMVENQFVQIPSGAENMPLDRVTERLNERLHGRPVDSITPALLEGIFSEIRLNEQQICESIKQFFRDLIFSFSRRVFVEGAEELIDQPEFQDAVRLRPVLEIVSEDRPESGVFSPPTGIRLPEVTIGGENVEGLRDCSIIKCHFQFGDRTIGTIGLVGPKRMEYPRLMRLVNHIADSLSKALTDFTLK